MRRFVVFIVVVFCFQFAFSQPVPNKEENIPFLMTFGNEAETYWGDDDYSQTFFFLIPSDFIILPNL